MRIGFLSNVDINLYLFRLPIMVELVNKGHEVFAIVPYGDKNEAIAKHGIKIVNYYMDRGSLNIFKEIRSIVSNYKSVKKLNLDIIHTFTVKPNIYGTISAKLSGIKHIFNLVEGMGSFYLTDGFKASVVRTCIESLYKAVFKLSEKVFFVNNDDPAYLVERGVIDKEKIVLTGGVGVDTKLWSPIPLKGRELCVVLMVARAIKHKGVEEFISAAKEIKKEFSSVEFWLVGGIDKGNPSSMDEEYLKKEKSIKYLGHRDDIREIMAESDIFVLPSYREGMPRTIMEAMSMGKPVVTTDVVGCRDCVEDGINGYIVKPKDAHELSYGIKRLLSDGEKRESMGAASRSIAESKYDISKIVKIYIDIYERCAVDK